MRSADAGALLWTRYAASTLRGVHAEPPPGDPPVAGLRAVYAIPYVHAALVRADDPRALQLKPDLLANELNSRLLDEMSERVAAALEHVEHVVFKGMVTRRRLAQLVPRRIATDVDLLVSPSAFGEAEAALRGAGFERLAYYRPFLQHFASERVFVDESLGVQLCVDLHRGLAPWPLAGSLAASVLQSRSHRGGLWIPDESHQLLTLAVHYIKEAVQLDVRDAMDAVLFLESSELSPSHLVELALRLRCVGALQALMLRIGYVAGSSSRSLAVEREIRARWRPASLVDATIRVDSPARDISTLRTQLLDGWRRGLCLDGPVHAGMAFGYTTAKALADRAWLTVRRSDG